MKTKPKFVLPEKNKSAEIAKRKPQLAYLQKYFSDSWIYRPHDEKFYFGLPHPYLVPDYRHFREFFYWDSFFIFVGLLLFEDTKELCKGIIQNFTYEMKRFGRIPNSNAYFSLSRSQSPYFALAIWEYLKKYPNEFNTKWVEHAVSMAEEEYTNYWLSTDKRYADHLMNTGLSRYWDINCDSDLFAVYESGWDTSSRFNDGCMNINPIDLNSQLHIYEKIFHWYYDTKKNRKKSAYWKKKMENRISLINTYCWDPKERIYFDYHFIKKKKTGFVSAASFYPFFAKIVNENIAKNALSRLLEMLEREGGIISSQKVPLKASRLNQWDYPHGWAPLQYIAHEALINYGFHKEAKRIREKWIAVCDYWFQKDKCFYEKYNVVKIGKLTPCATPARPGFGWTNGIYLKFLLED